MNLVEIIDFYNSDQGSQAHGYSYIYNKYFDNIRHEKLNFLEIGIGTGESVYVWYDYFNNSKIYMADIEDRSETYDNDRIRCIKCDQSDFNSLKSLGDNIGIIDVIIDDGGHGMHHQQMSIGVLFPNLKSGGMYFVEDLHTSNFPPGSTLYNQSLMIKDDYSNTTLRSLKILKESGIFESEFLDDETNRKISEMVGSVEFFNSDKLCLITKK